MLVFLNSSKPENNGYFIRKLTYAYLDRSSLNTIGARNVRKMIRKSVTFLRTNRRYRNSLRAGQSENRMPVGTRFSETVQTGPGARTAS